MPFESASQRRWMYANHPEMAKRWEKHTPKNKKLPEKKHKEKKSFVHSFVDAFMSKVGELREHDVQVLEKLAADWGTPPPGWDPADWITVNESAQIAHNADAMMKQHWPDLLAGKITEYPQGPTGMSLANERAIHGQTVKALKDDPAHAIAVARQAQAETAEVLAAGARKAIGGAGAPAGSATPATAATAASVGASPLSMKDKIRNLLGISHLEKIPPVEPGQQMGLFGTIPVQEKPPAPPAPPPAPPAGGGGGAGGGTPTPPAGGTPQPSAAPAPGPGLFGGTGRELKEKADVWGNRMKLLGIPLAIGTSTGFGLAKIFRPSDVEVGNLQKKELLAHYDTAISELERRIAAKHGEGALSKVGGTPSLAVTRATMKKPEYNLKVIRGNVSPEPRIKSLAETRAAQESTKSTAGVSR